MGTIRFMYCLHQLKPINTANLLLVEKKNKYQPTVRRADWWKPGLLGREATAAALARTTADTKKPFKVKNPLLIKNKISTNDSGEDQVESERGLGLGGRELGEGRRRGRQRG